MISRYGSILDNYLDKLLGTASFIATGTGGAMWGAQNAIDERKEKGDADKRTTTMLVASRLWSVQSMRHVLHPNCMPTIWPLHSGPKSHETCQNLATTLSFWMGPVKRKWTSRCWNWLFTSTSNSNVRRLLLQLCFQLWSLVVLRRSYHQGLVGRRICFASLHSPMVAASPSTSPGRD